MAQGFSQVPGISYFNTYNDYYLQKGLILEQPKTRIVLQTF